MIHFGNYLHAKMIARRSGSAYDPDVNYVISSTDDEELLGGVIYTNYTGRTVQTHIAGFRPVWATPRLLWVGYDFAFNGLRVERIIATIPSTNDRSLKINFKMGFTFVTVIPDVVVDGDMVILSMAREKCKYLKLGWRYKVLENAA